MDLFPTEGRQLRRRDGLAHGGEGSMRSAAPELADVKRLGGGYLPLEDHGLVGDGATAGLVGRDGAVSWLCLPRFDAPAVFCSILDTKRGGRFLMAPEELVESRQRYEPDSGVLATELRCRTGLVRVTDALTLRRGADLAEDTPAGRGELLRSAVVLDGDVRLVLDAAGGGAVGRRSALGRAGPVISRASPPNCSGTPWRGGGAGPDASTTPGPRPRWCGARP